MQSAIRVQLQPAVAGRLAADLEILAVGRELETGRRGGQQPDRLALLIERLMHMPPQHRFGLGEAVYHRLERVGIEQADGLNPLATYRDRMMMQANQVMTFRRFAQ